MKTSRSVVLAVLLAAACAGKKPLPDGEGGAPLPSYLDSSPLRDEVGSTARTATLWPASTRLMPS